MATYSKRLLAANFAVPSSVIYTSPGSTTTVIRDVEVANTGILTAQMYFIVTDVSGPTSALLAIPLTLGAGDVVQWEGRAVLEAEDTLEFLVTAGGALAYVSGYQLT